MRFYKALLRTIITLTSAFSFLGGWILLAHSLKPVSSTSSTQNTTMPNVVVTPFPTLTPLQGLNDSQSQSLAQPIQQPSFSIIAQPQAQVQTMPMFTTSGS